MSCNCYSAGKNGGTTHSQGKKPNSVGAKVTHSSGKSSGVNRSGHPEGAPAQGKGVK